MDMLDGILQRLHELGCIRVTGDGLVENVSESCAGVSQQFNDNFASFCVGGMAKEMAFR